MALLVILSQATRYGVNNPVQIPEEVRGEIIPLQEELHNLRRDLKGSVDSCRCDMEASDRYVGIQ